MNQSILRRFVPFPIRVEIARLRRLPAWLIEAPTMASHQEAAKSFPVVLAYADSPLDRYGQTPKSVLQLGKERNVALASGRINGVVIHPGQTFSYHHRVGRPSRLRGFQNGLELHQGEAKTGVGGGCCQVSNLLLLLALRGGMEVVERHRHGLDLFPDHGRSVPFGCGATVFYNLSDLRFRNPHSFPVQVRLTLADGLLKGEIAASNDPGWRATEYETDHQITREDGCWHRTNRIWRRFTDPAGNTLKEEFLFANDGRCLYDPEAA